MGSRRGVRAGGLALLLSPVLVLGGAVLVVQDARDGWGPARTVGRTEAFRAPATETTGSTATTAPTPGGTPRRLVVSRPRAAASTPFAASTGQPGLPPVSRGRAAHPGRVPFAPTSVRFVGGGASSAAAVDRVGTGDDGSLGLPEDPRRMGWWTGGSSAGAPYGSVVLAGHLDSRSRGPGFAARMAALGRGDVVVLADGDRQRRYRVSARYLLPRTRLSELTALFSHRGPSRLVLLTCGGDYDPVARAYSDNLVVEATPLP